MALTNSCYRNHCLFCLYFLPVVRKPSDRHNSCCTLMKHIGLKFRPKKGWYIVHECKGCGQKFVNKVAKDTDQPDDYQKIAML